MPAAVIELARVDPVSRVIVRKGIRADVEVNRSQSGIGWNTVQIRRATTKLYSWFRVPNVQKGPG